MKVITARNVNDAIPQALNYLLENGIPEPSRNGPVLVSPVPVTTVYECPWERVLFSPVRDANPFFHLMESLWMLAGRNDLEFPKLFNSKFGAYSDDGKTVRGAYGHRWRNWFGYDQLAVIIKELRENPASRRCVLAMWDGGEVTYPSSIEDEVWHCTGDDGDLLATTVDKPCNTHIYFRVRQDKHYGSTTQISDMSVLDMTVCCRSNDILWGAYGANAVHMSFLQEYMASAIGVLIGRYYQISNNFHLYTDVLSTETALKMVDDCKATNHYTQLNSLVPLVNTPLDHAGPGSWPYDLNTFFHSMRYQNGSEFKPTRTIHDPFFLNVAIPMYQAWMDRKTKQGSGLRYAKLIQSMDWRTACTQWIERREAAKEDQIG